MNVTGSAKVYPYQKRVAVDSCEPLRQVQCLA